MKKSASLFLVCLLFASVLSVSLISANILGTWFEKSPNSENANSNSITGKAFSWSWNRPRRAYCGDGKINVAGEECDRTNLGGKTCQTQGFSGGTLSCDLNNCRFVTNECTANSATVQKTCEQTKTLTRRTIGENQCGSEEIKRTLKESYRSCSGAFYRRICRNYYDYSCTKTMTTECSLTAACQTGTTEKSSVACTIPSSGNFGAVLQVDFGDGSSEMTTLHTSAIFLQLGDQLNKVKSVLTKSDLPITLANQHFSGNIDVDISQAIIIGSKPYIEYAKQPTSLDGPQNVLFIGSNAASNSLFNLTVTFSNPINFTNPSSKGQTLNLFGNKFLVDSSTDNGKLVLLDGAKKITLTNGNAVATGNNNTLIDGTFVTFVPNGLVDNLVSLSISFGGTDSDHDAIPVGGSYSDPLFNKFQLQFKNI